MSKANTTSDILAFAATTALAIWLIGSKEGKASIQDVEEKKVEESSNNNSSSLKYQIVFVLGGPGAGKGTQCENLKKDLGWGHLSAGDLLRAERKKEGSELASLINDCISAGKIVPASITATLLKNAMDKEFENSKTAKFLIDGFPRSEGNVTAWEELLGEETTGIARVEFVLFLDCPEDVMTGRLLERGLTSGRNDDNLDVIRKRFITFREESMPIVAMYEKQGKLRKIIADRSIDAVYTDVRALFNGL